ncbi:MAG: hypothetical protein NT154_33925 [Verrucomicrobia bacterium]|nr:hypothetical protein [Verrucomicrobiota bacterium]
MIVAHPPTKILTGFFIVAALLVVAALSYTLSQPAPTLAPLPKPNGYDDFVQAGRMLPENSTDFGTMGEEDLRTFVKKNSEALKLARTGLSRACQVPLDYSVSNQSHISNLAVLKRLALALAAEGRLAEFENRPADAVEAYVTVIRLGHALCRGGVIIDALVGVAIQSIGTARMEKLAPTLDAKQCHEVVTVLESCESRRELLDTVLANERSWARRTFGFKGLVAGLIQFKSLKQTEQRVAAKLTAQQTAARHMLIQLAARAYELEKGERPKSLAELVPAYLKTIPQDPLTRTNMAYP